MLEPAPHDRVAAGVQGVQAPAPAAEKKPLAHEAQADEPAGANVPALHWTQLKTLPVTLCAYPALHTHCAVLAFHDEAVGQQVKVAPEPVGDVRWSDGAQVQVSSVPSTVADPAGHAAHTRLVVAVHAVKAYSQMAAQVVQLGHTEAEVPATEYVPDAQVVRTVFEAAVQALVMHWPALAVAHVEQNDTVLAEFATTNVDPATQAVQVGDEPLLCA